MRAVDASPTAPASGAPYHLDRDQMVLRGRWRVYWRALAATLFLAVLQVPSRMVATGHWQPVSRNENVSGSVPARLSLLIDAGMVLAYVVLGVRALELVRVAPHRSARQRAWAWVGMAAVAAGAAANLAQDVCLWVQMGPSGSEVMHTASAAFIWVVVLSGLFLGFGLAWATARKRDSSAEKTPASTTPAGDPKGAAQDPPPRPDLVVCCSGGGIRAASFCLGGLQALKGRYQKADAVVGVSGGGYIAAAYHVHRWQTVDSKDGTKTEWGDDGQLAYAPSAPEEAWLRRHTRYLLDSPGTGVFALLSLLFGLAVNLLFIAALLGAWAWLASWFFLASGGVTKWDTYPSASNQYQGDWAWVTWVWAWSALGLALFVAAKALDRVDLAFRTEWRDRGRTTIVILVGIGAALALALLVLPELLVWLHNFARSSHTGAIPGALANLLTTLGFAGASAQTSAGASTATVSGTSLAAIAVAVLACLRAISAALTPADGNESPVAKVLSEVWGKVKGVVIPWVAAVVVVALIVAVFLSWTVSMLNDPDHLHNWRLVGIYAVLVGGAFLFTDANRTSLHHYYRERLATAYLVGQDKKGIPKAVDYSKPLRYSQSAPPAKGGGPKLVTCAVANVSDLDVVPTGRDCTPFVFSHHRIGLTEQTLPHQARADTSLYEFAADGRGRDATIPAAVAISAAAFSPLAGRENVKIRPYRLVLALANARLGVWLPNPLWLDEERVKARRDRAYGPEGDGTDGGSSWWKLVETVRDVFTKPSPLLVGREAFGRTSVLDRFLYVTDGGHYDNLGLVEALRRQAKTILVLDASNDREDSFATLGQAIATARMDLGCEVQIDPRKMRRVGQDRAKAAWEHGTVTYRKPKGGGSEPTGELWVAKAVMLDGLPWDVETYKGDNPHFPHTSTGNQFYGEFDLEAYRALGAAVVDQLLTKADKLPSSPLSSGWTLDEG